MVAATLIDTLSRIGAIGGILSIVGVALLILLVASQSRQIRSMKDWIDEEPQRQQETVQRAIAEVQRRIAAARERRTAAAAPAPVAPVVPRVKPAPGTFGATPEAIAIAKKQESVPPVVEPTNPGDLFPPATAAGGAETPKFSPLTPAGDEEASPVTDVPDDDEPAVVSEVLAQQTQASDSLAADDEDDFPELPSAAASRGSDVRFSDEHFDLESGEEPPRSNRLLFTVGAVALLAGIVIAAMTLFGGGDDNNAPATKAADTPKSETKSPPSTPSTSTQVNPATVDVRVFNGTSITGLGQRVTDKLKVKKYLTVPPETFAANQTATTTTVSYRPGSKPAAVKVASDLGLPASAVQPIDADTSLAAGENADVVVVAGADLNTSASTPTE